MKKGSTGTYNSYYKTDCVIGTGQFMATKNDHNNTKTKDGSWLVMEEEEMDISSKIKMLITIILVVQAMMIPCLQKE